MSSTVINPVHATGAFLYPLETLETRRFLMFSGVQEYVKCAKPCTSTLALLLLIPGYISEAFPVHSRGTFYIIKNRVWINQNSEILEQNLEL